ncbi:MAG: hypothetical protein H6737_06985 [Alphaproteobacteria bacterium]|nr:hypothetical protein [Alphaproteobacteria bacterium]
MKPPFAALVAVVLTACSPEPVAPADLRHDFGAVATGDFWAAPFPGAQVDGLGAHLADFPNPAGVDLVGDLIAMGDGRLTGAGTSSGIFFASGVDLDSASLPDLAGSIEPGSPIVLVDVDPTSPEQGRRFPFTSDFRVDTGPFGAPRLLSLLPVQGIPLRPGTTYAALVTTGVRTAGGRPLAAWPGAALLGDHACPDGLATAACEQMSAALDALGVDPAEVAGLTTFTTQDPTASLRRWTGHARATEPIPAPTDLAFVEEHEDFCVFAGTTTVPVYQSGEAPYQTEGGDIREDAEGRPVLDHREASRVVLTVPKSAGADTPLVVFVRTGAGGDRPLVDRGVRGPDGIPLEPGSGLARDFAQVGWAGLQIDGPHGGVRNATGADEQFLMFNVFNARALLDNVRQSALELALLPDTIEGWSPDVSACPGSAGFSFDPDRLALFGHSMGATIAPLTLALEPRYGAAMLSGAGGSWVENVVHKQSPLEVRPLAEAMLQYDGTSLHPHDPVLSLLQWVGESADPPVWGATIQAHGTHVLMAQGIVDTYILPPIANATTLSLGLDVAGPVLDTPLPYTSVSELLPLAGGRVLDLPVTGNRDGATRVVLQHAEDGVEDGHEVQFQLAAPKATLRGFLATSASGAPVAEAGSP